MNHFVFSFESYEKWIKSSKKGKDEYEFLKRRISNDIGDSINCLIAERKVSAAFMNDHFTCQGVLENRESYIPIFTKEDVYTAELKIESGASFYRKMSTMNLPISKRGQNMESMRQGH